MQLPAAFPIPSVFSGLYKGALHFFRIPTMHSFLFVEQGTLCAQLSTLTLSCSSGAYLYLPAEIDIQLFTDCAQIVLIRFSADAIAFPLYFGPAAVYHDPRASALFSSIAKSAEGAGITSALNMQIQLCSLLAFHQTLAGTSGNSDLSRITAGVSLLELEFLRNEPISRYAQACSLGENRFRALFSKCFGLSPVDYRNRLRLERADLLLKTTALPVHTAAQAAGFHSTSYFCRLYKKTYGHSPNAEEEDPNA